MSFWSKYHWNQCPTTLKSSIRDIRRVTLGKEQRKTTATSDRKTAMTQEDQRRTLLWASCPSTVLYNDGRLTVDWALLFLVVSQPSQYMHVTMTPDMWLWHLKSSSMKPVYVASRSKLFSNVHTSHLGFQVHFSSCVDEFVHHFPATPWRCTVKWRPPTLQERRRGGD